MAVNEFWLRQTMEFVRRLRDQCERCELCGGIACGQKHANWHTAVQNKLDNAQAAILDLRTRMTAAENEITSLKSRVTVLENPPPG